MPFAGHAGGNLRLPAQGSVTLAWWDRLLAWRDRTLAHPAFQHWAAGFPPTRPIARRRARAAFDLCAGFVYSQVLVACVRLDLFRILAEGPQPLHTLAARLGMPVAAAQLLLDAAVALRLASRRRGGRFGLGALGAALLGNPGVAAMVAHHVHLYADLADPVALLRGTAGPTALARYWPYAGTARPEALTAADVAAGSALMAASQAMIAPEVLAAYRFDRHRCVLDVGGGDGAFLAAVADAAPALQLMLFDLPAVAGLARARFAAAGLAGRTCVVGGDFRRDVLPPGADLISLVRVLHDHDDDTVRALLGAVRRALPAGGCVLIAEPMAGTRGAGPAGDAYFGFYLRAMGRGRPRTAATLAALLQGAGFVRPRLRPTRQPLLTQVLVATADSDGWEL